MKHGFIIKTEEGLQEVELKQDNEKILREALFVIADCPEVHCRDCNWAGHEDFVIEGSVDLCPKCNSTHLEDFEAHEYATQILSILRGMK